ncbi:MAG: GIY-YIG nuclease family protein [Eubacteriales bacterium]|nr:GIY-YIG nuclease family protein [Eubacteriales bacterium]
MCYVYIVACADGSLYTGWTKDLQKRICAHNAGSASRYTRSRLPVALKYFEELPTKSQALKRESALKKLSRKEKLELCEM